MGIIELSQEYLLNKYSKEFREKIIAEGVAEGVEKGVEKGIEIQKYNFTASLIQSTDFDDAKIAELVGVGVEYVAKVREGL